MLKGRNLMIIGMLLLVSSLVLVVLLFFVDDVPILTNFAFKKADDLNVLTDFGKNLVILSLIIGFLGACIGIYGTIKRDRGK